MRFTRSTAAGALLAAGLAAWSPGAAQQRVETAPPLAVQSCVNVVDPPTMPAAGATLTMAPWRYSVGGMQFATNVYNNSFVGPTLTMQPGEPMNLTVVNGMSATPDQTADEVRWTNQHYHGLVVTPDTVRGDNVTHIRIDNGGRRRSYGFPVPAGHTQGMFWYHPHPHGISGSQVAGGLSGALLVGSIKSYFPQYAGTPERVLLIRDMSFDLMKSVALLNINGNPCSRLPVRPGGQQLWHIGNFGSNVFVNLKLDGARWTLLALDGNPLMEPRQLDSLYLAPGTRAEVIVTGPAAGDSVRLFSAPIAPRLNALPVTLGWVVGDAGAPGSAPPPAQAAPSGPTPQILAQVERLRTATGVNRHTFTYSFPGEVTAAVNDSIYEPHHRPVSVPWGQVQEWTIVNNSTALHTFHIHQTDFLVISVNGRPADEGLLRDNVPVGVHPSPDGQGWAGDTVVVRFVFDPIAAGPFVFHCHVLQHEDEGMMHNVCVYDPNDPRGPRRCDDMFAQRGHAH